jgi:hypothetical protein
MHKTLLAHTILGIAVSVFSVFLSHFCCDCSSFLTCRNLATLSRQCTLDFDIFSRQFITGIFHNSNLRPYSDMVTAHNSCAKALLLILVNLLLKKYSRLSSTKTIVLCCSYLMFNILVCFSAGCKWNQINNPLLFLYQYAIMKVSYILWFNSVIVWWFVPCWWTYNGFTYMILWLYKLLPHSRYWIS